MVDGIGGALASTQYANTLTVESADKASAESDSDLSIGAGEGVVVSINTTSDTEVSADASASEDSSASALASADPVSVAVETDDSEPASGLAAAEVGGLDESSESGGPLNASGLISVAEPVEGTLPQDEEESGSVVDVFA